MGSGSRAYLWGKKGPLSLVDIFATGPEVIPSTVADQSDSDTNAESRHRLDKLEGNRCHGLQNTSPPAFSAPTLALLLPEKERPVLTAAIQHRCQALLTGDKTHFGRLYAQTIAGVSIHSPQGLAEALAEAGQGGAKEPTAQKKMRGGKGVQNGKPPR